MDRVGFFNSGSLTLWYHTKIGELQKALQTTQSQAGEREDSLRNEISVSVCDGVIGNNKPDELIKSTRNYNNAYDSLKLRLRMLTAL